MCTANGNNNNDFAVVYNSTGFCYFNPSKRAAVEWIRVI